MKKTALSLTMAAALVLLFWGCGLLLDEGSHSVSGESWTLEAKNPITSYDFGAHFSPLEDLKVIQKNTVTKAEINIPNEKCTFMLEDGSSTVLTPPDFSETYTFYTKTRIEVKYNGLSDYYWVNVNTGIGNPAGTPDGEGGTGIIIDGPY
ncbi:MAG: hypothetical protein LBG72_07505 [Spirochaetaceae bacterium]|jgi:hypothetical protein|nr:hypothetical protein [Spirochaetaceae bacterium]